MAVQIFIDYQLDSMQWHSVELLPEEYFDSTFNETIEWNSVPEWNEAIRYLDVDPESVVKTRIRISDDESNTRTITTTFWNCGRNQIVERVDKGSGASSYLMVITTLLQEFPSVWEIIRFKKRENLLDLEFHSFIRDNEDGSQTEKKIFPNDL
jgi:hypothetical protein